MFVWTVCAHISAVYPGLCSKIQGQKLPLIKTDRLWQPVLIRLLYLDRKYSRKLVSYPMPRQQSKHTYIDTNVSKVNETKIRWTVSNICSACCVDFLIRVCTVKLGISWAWQILSMILDKSPTWRTVLFYVFVFIYNSLHVSSTMCSKHVEN